MGNQWSQLRPPTAKFTEKDVPDQSGKVFVVTGGGAGIGRELASILYSRNARVYIAGRSPSNASAAISAIKSQHPQSSGSLQYHALDLADLPSVKRSADAFLAAESRLDVLWNNAGVMVPPAGSRTAQGYELQLGTNCLGPFLFTKLLTPLLLETAQDAPRGSVRTVWLSSSAAELAAPRGGLDMGDLEYKRAKNVWVMYGASKAGSILYAQEFARRFGKEGLLSASLNPGNLKTDLQRHLSGIQAFFVSLFLHDPINGAYTELFAGLSPELTPAKSGAFIIPWGRFGDLRKDLLLAGKRKSEGGTGQAEEFWEWSEREVRVYL